MGSLDRRVRYLEERAAGDADNHGQSETFGHLMSILSEIGYLRQSGARGLRGGVPIVPENIPDKILGPGYTHAQLVALAVERAVEAGRVPGERADAYTRFVVQTGERWRRGD